MRHLFLLCMDGHWFRGEGCAYDGWTFEGAANAVRCFEENPNLTIQQLAAEARLNDNAKKRIMIIECDDLPDNLIAFAARECLFRGAASLLKHWQN